MQAWVSKVEFKVLGVFWVQGLVRPVQGYSWWVTELSDLRPGSRTHKCLLLQVFQRD